MKTIYRIGSNAKNRAITYDLKTNNPIACLSVLPLNLPGTLLLCLTIEWKRKINPMLYDLLLTFLSETWLVLAQMGPYLLFGFLVAGILSVYINPEWVERHLGGRGMLPAVKAALFGVPLPLCSCGVIPVSTGIYRHGASRSATTSFLLSTPQTGVDSIAVTYALLGPVFAIFRPVVALLTGIIGGALVQFADDNGANAAPENKAETDVAGTTDNCECDSCEDDDNPSKIGRVLKYGFINLPKDIGSALLIGILIAGVMAAIVPPDYLGGLIGGGIVSILILMAAGVPVYVCATASVPIAAGFIHMGASPGAALAFLVAGPATNAATFTTIIKVLGKKTAIIYLSTVAVSAVVSGLFLNWLVPAVKDVMPQMSDHVHGAETISWISHFSAIILIVVVIFAYLYKPKPPNIGTEKTIIDSEMLQLNVTGMTCSHCALNVKLAAEEVNGVDKAIVNLGSGTVALHGQGIDSDQIIAAINSAGYTASKV